MLSQTILFRKASVKPQPKVIAAIGAKGMLGADLVSTATTSRGHLVIAVDLPEVDLCAPSTLDILLEHSPIDVLINCAAFTNVDDCEKDPNTAFQVNAEGVKHLATFCKTHGIHLVHFSTDYIFDGRKETPYREEDPPNPLGVYGKSKCDGERHVLRIAPRFTILRTAWLYGKHGKNFVDTIIRLAHEKPELTVVHDQIGSPTSTRDLADITMRIIEADVTGCYHVTNSGSCSWYEFACEILRLKGISTPVRPVTTEEFPRPAKRPQNSRLDTSKIQNALGIEIRHWKEALREYCRS